MRAGAAQSPSGYGIPPNPMPSDTAPEDVEWATPRRLPQPLKAFSTTLKLSAEISLPRSYIYCTKTGIGDTFGQFAKRAQREGWRYFEIDASHNPHITNPQALLGHPQADRRRHDDGAADRRSRGSACSAARWRTG